MATQPTVLVGRIPWTEDPGRLQPIGPQRVGHSEHTRAVIKAACSWHQNRQINGTGQKAQEETHALTFNDYEKRGKAKICNRGKNTVPSISCVGKSEQLHVKKSEILRVWAKLLSCVRLCDPVASNLPGSSVRGILQARKLDWVAMPSSRGSSPPREYQTIRKNKFKMV